MPDKKFFLFCTIPLFFLLVILISCEENFTTVGDGLLPQNDGLFVKIDTIKGLMVNTVESEPVITSNNRYPLVGHIKNDFLGEVSSSLITQFMPRFSAVSYSDTIVTFISANLILVVDSVYGNKYSPLTIRISQILTDSNSFNTGLPDSITYYSDQNYSDYYDHERVLAEETIIPATAIKIDSLEDDVFYYLEFPLPESFFTELYNIQKNILANTNFYINDTINDEIVRDYNFDTLYYVNNKLLGAIVISAYQKDETNGSLIKFDLLDYKGLSSYPEYLSKIEMTYSDPDTTSFYYYFNFYHSNISNYTRYEHTFSGYPVSSHINSSLNDDTICFLQSLAGLKSKIILPDMKKYFSNYDKVVINNAFLKIKEYTPLLQSSTNYSPSWIWGTIESNSYEQLSEEFYYKYVNVNKNGVYIDTLNQYTFNIPHVIQSMVTGDSNNEIYFFPVNPLSGAYYPGTLNYNYTIIDASSLELIITYATP